MPRLSGFTGLLLRTGGKLPKPWWNWKLPGTRIQTSLRPVIPVFDPLGPGERGDLVGSPADLPLPGSAAVHLVLRQRPRAEYNRATVLRTDSNRLSLCARPCPLPPRKMMRPCLAALLATATAVAALPEAPTCATVEGVVLGMGNDLGRAIAKTQGACCSACQAKPQCKSWTFHPKLTQCWLHGAVGPSKKEPDTVSGVPGGKMPPIPPPAPPHPHGGGGSSPMGGWSGPEACSPGTNGTAFKFCDHTLSMDARLDDLIQRVEVDEIALELTARQSEPLDRIGVPSYYWGTNAIHGMQNVECLPAAHGSKCPTSFAAPITLAASFNMSLVHDMGNVIGRELRAYYNAKIHNSLDTWSPTININRDPRWGRNVESPGEDPVRCTRNPSPLDQRPQAMGDCVSPVSHNCAGGGVGVVVGVSGGCSLSRARTAVPTPRVCSSSPAPRRSSRLWSHSSTTSPTLSSRTPVQDPTAWTTLRHDGSYHIGL